MEVEPPAITVGAEIICLAPIEAPQKNMQKMYCATPNGDAQCIFCVFLFGVPTRAKNVISVLTAVLTAILYFLGRLDDESH